MGNLVSYTKSQSSRNKALHVTDTDKAILDIRIARKQLVAYRTEQEKLAERSQQAVAELLAANKRDRAKLALKKKKLHEMQVLNIDRNILKLEEQVVALETTAQQVDTVDALRTANKAIKAMQKQMPLGEIGQLLDESEEANVYMDQVNEMLAKQQVDVTGLDEELDALEAEVVQEDIDTMPSAPTTVQPGGNSVLAQVEPRVHVRVDGNKEFAEVSFKIGGVHTEPEFPHAPTHEVLPEVVPANSFQGVGEQEEELVPA